MDSITIKNLEIFSNHGVLKEENVLGQKFLISCEIYLDTEAAGKSDDIEKSVNYSDICHTIKEIMEQNTFKLIERAAETISEIILLKYDKIQSIKTEVKKPWAPILLPLEYVSVLVERRWNTVFLSLGSNMNDKKANLELALSEFEKNEKIKNITVSDMIVTEPVGNVEQDDFLNCCVRFDTLYSPHELLDFTMETEKKAKRERLVHWGPRTLDIDIVLYGKQIIHDDRLTVPHIEMANRRFVLEPLCQLDPYAYNPALNKTAFTLFEELKTKEK